jgi:phosphate uptake regulator
MVADPNNVERAAILLFIAKDLERIADRVTNIAEDVVFLHTGHIVELS